MDDKNLEEEKKQQAGHKTAHVAGKAAANYFGGKLGNEAYNAASQTKVGQDIERAVGNQIANNPTLSKGAQKLNDSGALDLADKGIDAANGTKNNDLLKKNQLENQTPPLAKIDNQNQSNNNKKNNDSNSNANNSDSTTNDNNQASKITGVIGKIVTLNFKMAAFGCGSIFFVGLFVVTVLLYGVTKPMQVIDKFIQGLGDDIIDFFTRDGQKEEEEFYKTLKEVQQEMNKKYNVCIDVNLITATLTVNRPFDDLIANDQDIVLDAEQKENAEGLIESLNYKRMTKNIRLLAKMQIVNNNYSLDKEYYNANGNYCSSAQKKVAINSSNKNLFDGSAKDSSSYELISGNDKSSWFTKRVDEETNNAYYLYYPPFASDNTCTDSYARQSLESIRSANKAELSIGDYSTSQDSVYYWNLVNSFIEDYYAEYMPKDEKEKREKILEIADDIYLLYEDFGPSQTCSISYAGPSSLCPNGIVVTGNDAGTYQLEEYVAGVISAEAYASEGMEALKAQAVASRTYALIATNYCQQSISNSTNQQTFTKNINDRAREAASLTAGEILTYNGEAFSANYDSLCYNRSQCPDSKFTYDANGNITSYSVTYTKKPNGEKHTITLTYSKYLNDFRNSYFSEGQGHAMGMSQVMSYQLANEGYNYEQILKYFYSDGVEIDLVLSPNTTEGATIIQGPIENYLNTSGTTAIDFNNYIYDQVRKAGVGTREGVVAAAVSLSTGFYSKTGSIIPYELNPSGKYKYYGIDTAWGTNTGNAHYPLNGLDCSGFVSWAIHNGGFEYITQNAKDWGNSGNKRSWSKGTTDNTAQPGDLIYQQPPAGGNGTSGHIIMIVGKNENGYIVAEASGGKGVRVSNLSFTSPKAYYLVDMSNYYANSTVVSDYPQ